MKYSIVLLILLLSSHGFAQTEVLKLSSDVWPPFTNVTEEKSIALDIVKEALNRVNVSVEYTIADFDEVMKGIESGMFDGSAALWRDESREEHLLFSDAYLQNQLILVGKKGSKVDVESISEFENKKIGAVKDYAYGDALSGGNNNQIIYSKSDQQNLEKLISNEIDYFLVDALLVQYLLKYQLNDVSELLEIAKDPLIVKSLHLAIRKEIPDADQITHKFNEAIRTMMADGSYNEILELNWVKADVDGDGITELILSGSEAGKTAPVHTYEILYSGQNLTTVGYYVNETMYKSWDEVPEQYKVDIPKVNAPSSLEDANMKIKL